MNFVSRHTATRLATGTKASARINQAEEMVQIPWMYQLCLEGRVFCAGLGLEEDGIDTIAALDDQKPMAALYAPAYGTIVIPLYFRAYLDTQGGAAPDWKLAYVQEDKFSPATIGAAIAPLNCLGGASPRRAQAHCNSSITATTAFVDDDHVIIHERIQVLNGFVGTEAATLVQGIEFPGTESSMEFCWTPETPIVLRNYSGILFWAYTGSSNSKYNYTFAWAELDEDTYKV